MAKPQSPYELDKDKLMDLAAVLFDLKEALEVYRADSNTAWVDPYPRNEYVWVRAYEKYDTEESKEATIAVLNYLLAQGVLTSVEPVQKVQHFEGYASISNTTSFDVTVADREAFFKYADDVFRAVKPFFDNTWRRVNATPAQSQEVTPNKTVKVPAIKLQLSGGFAIHENNIISYNGKEIVLQRRERKVAVAIMTRWQNGLYTDRDYIVDNLLESDNDYKNPYSYAVNLVSVTRKAFQAQLNKKHEYFPVKRDSGYKFAPEQN